MNNINLTQEELSKLSELGTVEIYTEKQFNSFIEMNEDLAKSAEIEELDEIQKGDYEEFVAEIQSFSKAEVFGFKEGSNYLVEKSICYIRPKQVEWTEEEVIEKSESGEEIITKSKSGIYTDTSLNRKMGRVGAKYGSKKDSSDDPEYDPNHAASIKDGKNHGVLTLEQVKNTKMSLGDHYIVNGLKFKVTNMKGGHNEDQPQVSYLGQVKKSGEDDLEKSRVAQIGEVRIWNGKKYRKQGNGGWVEISERTPLRSREPEKKEPEKKEPEKKEPEKKEPEKKEPEESNKKITLELSNGFEIKGPESKKEEANKIISKINSEMKRVYKEALKYEGESAAMDERDEVVEEYHDELKKIGYTIEY